MAGSSFKVGDKLKAAIAAQQAGNLEDAQRAYLDVLARFPGNSKAKAGLSKVETKLAASKASGFDQNFFANPLNAPSLGALSGIEDPLAIPKSAARVAPARGAQPDLLGASAGVNAKQFKLSKSQTPAQINQRGREVQAEGRLGDSVDLYREALEADPELYDAQNNLGIVLQKMGRRRESIEVLEDLIERQPNMVNAMCNLGLTFLELDMNSEAIEQYKRALDVDPTHSLAWCNLGNTYARIGRKDDALACFENSIEQDPTYTTAFLEISAVKKAVAGDPLIETMLNVLKTRDLDGYQEYRLNFALGKAYADSGDTKKAFRHIQLANRRAKEVRKLNLDKHKALFNLIRSTFDADDTPRLLVPEIDDWSVSPIFVVGMPRSGSTLIERVISSHSQVHAAGEIGDFPVIMTSVVRGLANKKVSLNKEILYNVRRSYLERVKEMSGDKKFVTDKNLLNFRYIGMILSAFPEAKIIHMNRDPMAVCWSNFKHHFVGDGISFAYDLDDLGEFYNMYLDLMAFWREKFPNRIVEMNYEDFTRDQEGETRALLKNCGLEFEDACLNFHKSDATVKTASMMQVRQKVYQGSSQEWEKYRPYLKDLIAKVGT